MLASYNELKLLLYINSFAEDTHLLTFWATRWWRVV